MKAGKYSQKQFPLYCHEIESSNSQLSSLDLELRAASQEAISELPAAEAGDRRKVSHVNPTDIV